MIHSICPHPKALYISCEFLILVHNKGALMKQQYLGPTLPKGIRTSVCTVEGSRASGSFCFPFIFQSELRNTTSLSENETVKELNSWAISQKCLDTLTDSTEQTVFSKVSSGEYLQHHHRQCSLQSGPPDLSLFHQNLRNRKERKSWQGSTL